MLITRNVLLSSVGVISVFQEPFTHCCRPSPGPDFEIPAQTYLSGAQRERYTSKGWRWIEGRATRMK